MGEGGVREEWYRLVPGHRVREGSRILQADTPMTAHGETSETLSRTKTSLLHPMLNPGL